MDSFLSLDLGSVVTVVLLGYIIYLLNNRRKKRATIPRDLPLISLTVKFENERWEVQLDGSVAGKVSVRRGQKIRWTIEGAEATYNFPSVLFGVEDALATSEPLTLTVSTDVPTGRYIYSVEIDGECAVGGSPPTVMVEDEI